MASHGEYERYMGKGRGSSVNNAAQQSNLFGESHQPGDGFADNLKLVPCRWSHTGWKYVQDDPAKTNFFSSPNRVNSFGFNQEKSNKLRK